MEEIQQRLPGFTVVSSGFNGQHVGNLLERVDRDVVQHRPDIVFLFSDSDMSATPYSVLDSQEFQDLSTQMTMDVILSIKNVSSVIMSGPVRCCCRRDRYSE